MAKMDCYGVSVQGGFGMGAKVDIGVCREDGFPYFSPRVSAGVGMTMIGVAASGFSEKTEYDNSDSYTAETSDSWYRTNVPTNTGVALFGKMDSVGRSDTDYNESNVKREDYMVGLLGYFSSYDEVLGWAPGGTGSFDLVALAWNGLADAGEVVWHGARSVAIFVADNASRVAMSVKNGAQLFMQCASEHVSAILGR